MRAQHPSPEDIVRFSDAPAPARHIIFRDWLRAHPEDREVYRDAKRAAAAASNARGERVSEYKERKSDTIREIYARAFRDASFID